MESMDMCYSQTNQTQATFIRGSKSDVFQFEHVMLHPVQLLHHTSWLQAAAQICSLFVLQIQEVDRSHWSLI